MYHIKEDVRAEKSANLLYDGLVRCLAKKGFDKVGISDICTASGVSRAAFYRNFDSAIDLLYWKCDRLFREVLTDFVTQQPNLNQADSLIHHVFSFWMSHADVLEMLLGKGRVDIIYNSFLNNAGIVMDYLEKKLDIPPLNSRYFIATRAGVFVGVFQAWIHGGKKESAETLSDLLSQEAQVIGKSKFLF